MKLDEDYRIRLADDKGMSKAKIVRKAHTAKRRGNDGTLKKGLGTFALAVLSKSSSTTGGRPRSGADGVITVRILLETNEGAPARELNKVGVKWAQRPTPSADQGRYNSGALSQVGRFLGDVIILQANKTANNTEHG